MTVETILLAVVGCLVTTTAYFLQRTVTQLDKLADRVRNLELDAARARAHICASKKDKPR